MNSAINQWLRAFRHRQHGASAAEFAMVVMVFVVFTFAIVDFGRLLWTWTQAAKATQLGARAAVVNNIVATGLQDFDGLVCGGNGLPVPVACLAGNPTVCTNAACNFYGPVDAAAFTTILTPMQGIFGQIQPTNVVVEYEHIGLGYIGNPFGGDIVPMVTVRLQNMVFEFITPGFSGLVNINMPGFATTLTGEDFAP